MTLEDDNFHPPESDDWWEHETLWFLPDARADRVGDVWT